MSTSYYIKSKNIKIYPSGYRGLITANIEKAYNPESKTNVEANTVRTLISLINYKNNAKDKEKGDLVISENFKWESVPSGNTRNYVNFEFICKGYYFKIIDSYEAFAPLLTVENEEDKPDCVYAKIGLSGTNMRIPVSTQDRGPFADINNICYTEKHLANLKVGENSGQLTSNNENDDASEPIVDFSSLDEHFDNENYFTGVQLVTEISEEDRLEYHYFKILERESSESTNYIVPQEAKLITDTNHIWGGEDSGKVKCLHDLLETRKIKSHSAEGLEIKSEGNLNVDATSKNVSITSSDVIIKTDDAHKTEIKGNEINTTTVKGYTNLTLTCETADSTLTLKSPKIQLVNDNTKLLVEYTPSEFLIKQQTSSTKTLSYTDSNGLVLNDSDAGAPNKVKITSSGIQVGANDNTATKISNKDIYTQDIYLTNQKATTVNNALQIGLDGKISGVALSATSTPSGTQIVNYVSGITQAANGAIAYTTSSLPKIGESTDPETLQGLAKVEHVDSYTNNNAHNRYIQSTYDPNGGGGTLFVKDVNTVLETMVEGKEYPLIARKYAEEAYGWFKTGCYNGSIKANSTGRLSAVSFYATSDKRLKENIKPLKYTKSILDLPVYTYDYIDGQKNNIGCLAQDLQKLYPELVSQNSDGYLMVDNSKVVYLLLEEVKLLKKELAEIKTKLK